MALRMILKSATQALYVVVPIIFMLWILLAMGIEVFPVEVLLGYAPIAFFLFIGYNFVTFNWSKSG